MSPDSEDSDSHDLSNPVPEGWARLDPGPLLAQFADYYGIPPERFAGLDFWQRTPSGSVWAIRADHAVPLDPAPETLGLRVRRGDKPPTQLSNAFLRRFFAGATRHALTLEDPAHVLAYFARDPLPGPPPTGDGYYVVLGLGGVLGRARAHDGQLRGEPSKNERLPPVL